VRIGAVEEVGPHAGSAQNGAPSAGPAAVVPPVAAMSSRSDGNASTTAPGMPHRGTSRPGGPAPRRARSSPRAASSGVPGPDPEPETGPAPGPFDGSDDGPGSGVDEGDGCGVGDGDGPGEGDGDELGEGDGDGEGDGSSLGDGFFPEPAVAAAAGSATQIAQRDAVGAITMRVHATSPATIGVLRWRRSVISFRALRGISLPR
jgi:hypothetical protein